MKSICDRDDTWIFLIKRDFNIDYNETNPRRYYFLLYDAEKTRNLLNSSYTLYSIVDASTSQVLYNIIASDHDDMIRIFATKFRDNQLPDELKLTILDSIDFFEEYNADDPALLNNLIKEKVSTEMDLFGFTIPEIPYPFNNLIDFMTTEMESIIAIKETEFTISNSILQKIK
jgi:hypothetical protein